MDDNVISVAFGNRKMHGNCMVSLPLFLLILRKLTMYFTKFTHCAWENYLLPSAIHCEFPVTKVGHGFAGATISDGQQNHVPGPAENV